MAAPGMRPESGWQTHGSNGGDPLASAVIWESISFLSLSRSQPWLGGFQTLSSLKFDSPLTYNREGEKPYRASLAPSYAAPPGPLWRNPP